MPCKNCWEMLSVGKVSPEKGVCGLRNRPPPRGALGMSFRNRFFQVLSLFQVLAQAWESSLGVGANVGLLAFGNLVIKHGDHFFVVLNHAIQEFPVEVGAFQLPSRWTLSRVSFSRPATTPTLRVLSSSASLSLAVLCSSRRLAAK